MKEEEEEEEEDARRRSSILSGRGVWIQKQTWRRGLLGGVVVLHIIILCRALRRTFHSNTVQRKICHYAQRIDLQSPIVDVALSQVDIKRPGWTNSSRLYKKTTTNKLLVFRYPTRPIRLPWRSPGYRYTPEKTSARPLWFKRTKKAGNVQGFWQAAPTSALPQRE